MKRLRVCAFSAFHLLYITEGESVSTAQSKAHNLFPRHFPFSYNYFRVIVYSFERSDFLLDRGTSKGQYSDILALDLYNDAVAICLLLLYLWWSVVEVHYSLSPLWEMFYPTVIDSYCVWLLCMYSLVYYACMHNCFHVVF